VEARERRRKKMIDFIIGIIIGFFMTCILAWKLLTKGMD